MITHCGSGACPPFSSPILALAVLVASSTASTTHAAVEAPPDVVRVNARPDLPWVTAVLAPLNAGGVDEKRVKSSAPVLSDIGVRMRVEKLDGFDVVVVDGPPEAHDAIIKAARTAGGPTGGVLFVDGRTTLVERGALPSRMVPPRAASAKGAQPLSPSPGLVDVEGAALALLVGGRIEDGALVVDKPDRAALEALVAAPLTPKRVDELRSKARGAIAERRAKAGGWARDMARMWLAYGTLDVEEPKDLGSALRARVFPSVLAR
jgi:hypothetical protein